MRLRRSVGRRFSQIEAMDVFDDFVPDLIKCVETGWQVWKDCEKQMPKVWVSLRERARAAFVYDQILADAKSRFEGVAGVRVIEQDSMPVLFEFSERALLGFKKLSRTCHPSSYATQQQEKLLLQQLSLPGLLPELPYVVFGYRLNKLGNDLRDLLMVRPQGLRRIDWAWAVTAATPGVVQTPLFAPPQVQEKAKVRAKNVRKTKEAE